MTRETHYLGSAMVVLLDKSPYDDLLETYKYVRNPASMEYDPKPYMRIIRELLPECLEESASITPTTYFAKVQYNVPLLQGRVAATLEFTDNLEEKISPCYADYPVTAEIIEKYRQQLRGKSGAIFRGAYRLGKDPSEGPQFGYHQHEVITAFVANAFCWGEEIGKALESHHHRWPLGISQNEVQAALKDLTSEKLRQADTPLSEFFLWMRREMLSLNTIRELLIQGREEAKAERRFKELQEKQLILPEAEQFAKATAAGYIHKACDIIETRPLTPPKNNRMDYLVAD